MLWESMVGAQGSTGKNPQTIDLARAEGQVEGEVVLLLRVIGHGRLCFCGCRIEREQLGKWGRRVLLLLLQRETGSRKLIIIIISLCDCLSGSEIVHQRLCGLWTPDLLQSTLQDWVPVQDKEFLSQFLGDGEFDLGTVVFTKMPPPSILL